jgi:transcriptional regulator with XRE-family HTH domain
MRRLRAERVALGLSQAELARRSGLNATTVCQAESGRFRPYPAQLRKLARALGVPAARAVDLLLEVTGDDEPAA